MQLTRANTKYAKELLLQNENSFLLRGTKEILDVMTNSYFILQIHHAKALKLGILYICTLLIYQDIPNHKYKLLSF